MINSLKAALKSNKFIFRHYLNLKNHFNLKSNLMVDNGQIKDENLKVEIENILNKCSVKNIVEVGTWNGLGSTKMIINLIKNHKERINFFSVESDKLCYKIARQNLKNDSSFVKLILGRVYDMDDLSYVTKESIFEFGYNEIQYEWWVQDLRRYKKNKNILNKLPKKIDILLLDGGEFSTFADFLALYTRTKYLILDDTKTYKQHLVLDFIKNNGEKFEAVVDLNIRNGMKIYKHLETSSFL